MVAAQRRFDLYMDKLAATDQNRRGVQTPGWIGELERHGNRAIDVRARLDRALSAAG